MEKDKPIRVSDEVLGMLTEHKKESLSISSTIALMLDDYQPGERIIKQNGKFLLAFGAGTVEIPSFTPVNKIIRSSPDVFERLQGIRIFPDESNNLILFRLLMSCKMRNKTIELKIDPEFRDLLPPLTAKEYSGLEESLLTTGFDTTFPIIVWKGHETIVDGHNCYEICKKHNIQFVTVEHEFESRSDVLKWILDRQLDRRNLNNLKRIYLVGRRYLVEKKALGDIERFNSPVGQNDPMRSSAKIADQLSIGEKTVRRAADFTLALDTIVSNTGIAVNDILDGKIPSRQQGIIALAGLDKESQKRVIDLILQDERDTVELAIDAVEKEKRDQPFKEAEENKRKREERKN